MNRLVSKLEDCGLIRKTVKAQWIAAPLIVSRPPPTNFRFNFHLRPINTATKLMTWPMPNMESETDDMRESRCFASIDFPSSFWKAPMHEDYQHLHSFMANALAYMPTRTLQGGRSSAKNFEGKVVKCFSELSK